MDPILELARRRGLTVIEDAAEAHGALYRGRPAGSLGEAAVFSFYGNKIITTGEGGMVITNNAEAGAGGAPPARPRFLRGPPFLASLSRLQLPDDQPPGGGGAGADRAAGPPGGGAARQCAAYGARLAGVSGLRLPVELPEVTNVFWMYALRIEDGFGCSRDELRRRLARQGIETRTFFIPVHLQPIYFRRFRGQAFPVAEELCRTGLYLPSGPSLTAGEVAWVAEQLIAAASSPSVAPHASGAPAGAGPGVAAEAVAARPR